MDVFKDKEFDVEHALNMYATSYVTIPAFGIYEDALVAPLLDQIRHCHIYLVGLVPKIKLVGISEKALNLITSVEVRNKQYDLSWPMPEGAQLRGNELTGWYAEDASGNKYTPKESVIQTRLSNTYDAVDFKVLYVGQAFGEDGSRNALDRLKKHETLQKIAVKGIPEGYVLTILMLAIEPANRLVTVFNPHAKDTSHSSERLKMGLDKLFNTSEAERTTLYEASLIRYFQPAYNKEFKNSFPSTNMKLLADCYDKDFSGLLAEICIDELPFKLFSDAVKHQAYHIVKHNLHTDASRRLFFMG